MKKITTTHASIRYDVLKKNLLYNQEVLVTYASLLKAEAVGAPPPPGTMPASLDTSPIDHIAAAHLENPTTMISAKLSSVVPTLRENMKTMHADDQGGGFVYPHGELYEHLDGHRANLAAAAALPETLTVGHVHQLAADVYHANLSKDKKHEIDSTFNDLGDEDKKGIAKDDYYSKLAKIDSGSHGRLYDGAKDTLLGLDRLRKHPDFLKHLNQMKKEQELERNYATKVSEDLHRNLQAHLAAGKKLEDWEVPANLGQDPKLKHSERAWQEKHLDLGRKLWAKYRQDMKHGKPGATGDPAIDGDAQTLLPANQFWTDRGFAAGVRLGADLRSAEPSYEYLQTALKERDRQRQAYFDAYGAKDDDSQKNFDALPLIRRFGVSSSVPQNELEKQFLEKKANEFASKAMKEHRANVDVHADKLRKEQYLEQRIQEIQQKSPASVGGNSEKTRQIEELQGELDKERRTAFLFNRHNRVKNFHEIQIDNDSHFDPYITDAFRYLHSAGLAHVRDEGPETYARMRQRATQNRVAEEQARAQQPEDASTKPGETAVVGRVDLTSGPTDPVGSTGSVVGTTRARSTVAFKPIVPTDAYGVKPITLPSGLDYDPGNPENYINELFKYKGFSSQLGYAFSDEFLNHFKDEKGVLNMKKMKESFIRALTGAGRVSVLKILEKLGVKDSAGNGPDTEAFKAMENSPELSRDTGNHVFANPGSVRKAAMSAENKKVFRDTVTEAIKNGTQVDLVREILSRKEVSPGVTISLDRMFSDPADYHAALASTHLRNYAGIEARVAEADTSGTERPSREQMTMTALQSELEAVFNEYNEEEQKDIAKQILQNLVKK